MALFDKLFLLKRRLDSENCDTKGRERSRQINSEQVRLLLFKECDWRGRRLLFDSSSIKKVLSNKNDKPSVGQNYEGPCTVEVSNGYTYVYKGPEEDTKVLGEMIFGAVAMNCKNVSLKIHFMDEPRRLMYTKVFCLPSRRVSRPDRKTSDIVEPINLRSSSKPLNVPSFKEEGVSLSFSLDRGDSGFCGDNSSFSSYDSTYDYFSMLGSWDCKNAQEDLYSFHSIPGRKLSTSSNGSWQRRTFQNIATRFDLGSSQNLNVPTACSNTTIDSQVYSNSSTSTSVSLASGVSLPQRKNKFGLALLITVSESSELDLVNKCMEHSPQIESLLCRLRLATMEAGTNGMFVSTLYKASEDAATWLSDLIYGPKLQPIWLNMVTSDVKTTNKLADSLLNDLCSVLDIGDTKTTNFFISTLLTHVLTFHLGWVTSVSPYERCVVAGGYNARWAQLHDLSGAIGHPPRPARTLLSGRNKQFLEKLLRVLAYFIRSGDVYKTEYRPRNPVMEHTKIVHIPYNDPVIERTKTVYIPNNDSTEYLNPVNTHSDSVSTLVPSEVGMKRSSTLASLSGKLSSPKISEGSGVGSHGYLDVIAKVTSDSSLSSSEPEPERKVVFVLGDSDKLIGLKNKSNGGKSVKKSSKNNEPIKEEDDKSKDPEKAKSPESPSKCCGQTLEHSKPIKHSGFKFEFDKYPQIVTNYMKSKNLEILDRHYIGKPGNLKLDNFQFDPTIVPPIQEEKCETCVKCQLMESTLQTPTNASEMEYMNDLPGQSEPQYAEQKIVTENEKREMSPKTFVRLKEENTIIVNTNSVSETDSKESSNKFNILINIIKADSDTKSSNLNRLKSTKTVSDLSSLVCEGNSVLDNVPLEELKPVIERRVKKQDKEVNVRKIIEIPLSGLCDSKVDRCGYEGLLHGGVTDHYVPDLILQGTLAKPNIWEMELRRDLDLTSYLNKSLECSIQAVAIIGDTNTWEVRVVGRECGTSGMSSLVGTMLDVVSTMWKAKVPANQCISFIEGKLREFCVLSKTLADMLMTTDFCDIATLTKSLNIDVNDVPLLLAVATTHTPQVASRYGISYR